MSSLLFNWVDENRKVRDFLDSSQGGTLHVLGNENSRPLAFIENVKRHLCDADASRPTCSIDASNLATSSPLGALRAMADTLGIVPAAPSGRGTTNIASNVYALRGPVNISGISYHSETEEVYSLATAFQREIDSGARFDRFVILFLDCDAMEESTRKGFHSTVWSPILVPMTAAGAKVIFQYAPRQLVSGDSTFPPFEGSKVRLPEKFDGTSVVMEISKYLLDRGKETDGKIAEGVARTILTLSPTIADVYRNLLVYDEESEGWTE